MKYLICSSSKWSVRACGNTNRELPSGYLHDLAQLKRLSSKTIHILYLPKTRPPAPPIAAIPRPSRDLLDTPCINDRVKTLKLPASWPNGDNQTSSKLSFSDLRQSDAMKSIYVSVSFLYAKFSLISSMPSCQSPPLNVSRLGNRFHFH